MYAGTSGRTHGDANEISPAVNAMAAVTDTCFTPLQVQPLLEQGFNLFLDLLFRAGRKAHTD